MAHETFLLSLDWIIFTRSLWKSIFYFSSDFKRFSQAWNRTLIDCWPLAQPSANDLRNLSSFILLIRKIYEKIKNTLMHGNQFWLYNRLNLEIVLSKRTSCTTTLQRKTLIKIVNLKNKRICESKSMTHTKKIVHST